MNVKKIFVLTQPLILVLLIAWTAIAADVNYSFTGNCGSESVFYFAYDYGESDGR